MKLQDTLDWIEAKLNVAQQKYNDLIRDVRWSKFTQEDLMEEAVELNAKLQALNTKRIEVCDMLITQKDLVAKMIIQQYN